MRTTIVAAALAAFVLPSAGLAFDASGTGVGTSNTQPMPIHDGLVVVHASTDYTGFETDNPDNALASAKGPCWGSMLIDKGAVSGGGLCHYTDADGDQVVMRWTPEEMVDGRTKGSWEVVGGSGKWMAASGGGSFDSGTTDGKYENHVTGEITMN